MLILNNEKIDSRSGPAKSINLLKSKLFKKKKYIYCFFGKEGLNYDVTIYNKNYKKNLFSIIDLFFKNKVIYINGIFSFVFCVIPLIISFFLRKKIIISPRGQIAPETLIKKKYIKLAYFYFLYFIQKYSSSKIFWLVTSLREKNYLQYFINFSELNITIIDNLNDLVIKKIKPIKKKKNSLRIFYFSNLTKKKNILETINIIKNCNNKNIKLDIYGKIIDHSYFKKVKKEIKGFSNISYKSYVSKNNDREKIFLNYNLLMHNSLGENYGHILVEAMAHGIPFVSNDTHPWVNVDNDFDGFVSPLNLIFQQSEMIKYLSKIDNNRYQIYRKKFFNFYKKEIFTKEKLRIKNYLDFFDKVNKYKFAKK
tara:strand:+ start:728 stop:1828 length:1101 start_codon:yes stop_codon:yes gene_type:complete